MNKYYYYLIEQPDYPMEIFAKSIEEARFLLCSELADASSIVKIVLANDNQNIQNIQNNNFDSNEPSLNNILNSIKNQDDIPLIDQKVEMPIQQQKIISNINIETKFFEDNGIKFKLENGKLFKKIWKKIDQKDLEELRILTVDKKRQVDLSKYEIEKLSWEEIT